MEKKMCITLHILPVFKSYKKIFLLLLVVRVSAHFYHFFCRVVCTYTFFIYSLGHAYLHFFLVLNMYSFFLRCTVCCLLPSWCCVYSFALHRMSNKGVHLYYLHLFSCSPLSLPPSIPPTMSPFLFPSCASLLNLPHNFSSIFMLSKILHGVIAAAHRFVFSPYHDDSTRPHHGRSQHFPARHILAFEFSLAYICFRNLQITNAPLVMQGTSFTTPVISVDPLQGTSWGCGRRQSDTKFSASESTPACLVSRINSFV